MDEQPVTGPSDPVTPPAAPEGATPPPAAPVRRATDGGPAAGRAADGRGRLYRGGLAETHFTLGLNARVSLTVDDGATAQAVGSGDVPVLGTPRLLALAETATVAATARHLPSGMTTVGAAVSIEHLAPVPVGRTISALASLARLRGRRLGFDISVTDGSTVVARGRVERVLVDRQAFVESAFTAGQGRPGGPPPGPGGG